MGNLLSRNTHKEGKHMTSSIPAASLSYDPEHAWSVLHESQRFIPVPRRVAPPSTPEERRDKGVVRVVCISDTHGKHRGCSAVPNGDVLIHGGDFTNTGEMAQVQDFEAWLGEMPHGVKIVVAGNHDITMQESYYTEKVAKRFCHKVPFDPKAVRSVLVDSRRVVYLEDRLYTLPNGLKLYGSPWQPEFADWAFNLERGEPCREAWGRIPEGVHVLITHGPPLGRGDATPDGVVGCVDLLQAIQSRVKPAVHICGHVHESYGTSTDGTTTYINASTCTYAYRPINPAIVFEVEIDSSGNVSPPVVLESRVVGWSGEQVAEWVASTLATRKATKGDGHALKWDPKICAKLSTLSGKELLSVTDEDLGRWFQLEVDAMQKIAPRNELMLELRELEALHI